MRIELLGMLLCLFFPLVASEAIVEVQNAIVIPRYQSHPCNVDHPNNCPKPVNHNRSENCNESNRCRNHPMFYEDGSGNRFLVWLVVEGGPANRTDLVLREAVTTAITRWLMKKTKNNASQEFDAIDGHSPTSAELQDAASGGIQAASTPASDSALTEKEASFDPFYANLTITGSHPGKPLMFEFSTIAKGLGEADVDDMMKPVTDMFRKLWLKATRMESEGHEEGMSPPKH